MSNIKSFHYKRGIEFEEGVFTFIGDGPKFTKSTTQDTKMNFVIVVPKGELVFMSQSPSSKVNTSPISSYSYHTICDLLPLPTTCPPIFHQ